jgi:riboflavin kinase/FMN adenylyltransferase
VLTISPAADNLNRLQNEKETMQVIYGLEKFCQPDRAVTLAIGNFDGVHVGHQTILQKVVEVAHEHALVPTVMTFEYHPAKLLHPEMAPDILMPMEERIAIMESLGIELVLVVRCRKSFFQATREEFVRHVLTKSFNLKYIVEGSNFRFGADRSGDINYLIEIGSQFGFEGIKIEPVRVDFQDMGVKPVSSSLIRKLVSTGRVDLARLGLGRCYTLVGQVISGAQRGRTLGFPTANLNTGGQLLPQFGIYAAKTRINNRLHPTAAIIGPAPTFEQYQTAIEAFLLDYQGDLYGKNVHLHLYKKIRDIVKFDTTDSLVEQIGRDVQTVQDLLKNENGI